MKQAFEKLLLTERLRWNDELKVHTVRIYTATQAMKLFKALRELDDHDKDLLEAPDLSAFESAKSAEIAMFPLTITEPGESTSRGRDMLCLAGRAV